LKIELKVQNTSVFSKLPSWNYVFLSDSAIDSITWTLYLGWWGFDLWPSAGDLQNRSPAK